MGKDTRPLTLVYRPQQFKDLVGNDMIRTILLNSIKEDKVRTAYFFCGGRGSGKTTSARIFAKALNCLHPVDGEPCNECESCRLINDAKSLDVIEIDAASENSVQSIRELSNSIQYAPINSKRKVVILDEVHCLTVQASNALLKTLEEPPAHVVFIFCTTDPQKVLETIKSRTMMFQFQRLQTQEISERLKWICSQESIPYEEEALSLISFSVNGGMRDAITLLDQASIFSGKVDVDTVKNIVGFVSYKDVIEFFSSIEVPEKALKWVSDILKKNAPLEVINSILRFIENMILVQNSVVSSSLTKDILDEQKILSTKFDYKKLSQFMAICFKTIKMLKQNQVYDSSIFLIDLYLSFYSVVTGNVRTSQSDASLLDTFRGVSTMKRETTEEILNKYFSFKVLEGELVLPE